MGIKATTETAKLIKSAAMAHKHLMRYSKEHGIPRASLTATDPVHGPIVKDWLDAIQAARHASYTAMYNHVYDSIKVHPLKTKDGLSHRKQRQLKALEEAKRSLVVFEYPAEILCLSENAKASYRELFNLHKGSGMPTEQAESLALQDFRDSKNK